MLRRFLSFVRVLVARDKFELGMNDELRFHISQYTQDLIRSGLSEDEANRRARIEFGGLNGIKADCRQARGVRLFDELTRQIRYAVRLLLKTPGFTVTALSTLAVCIGANLTLFAVIDTVLLRPLPFPQPAQLVTIFNTYPKAGVDRDGSSITNYYERRERISAFRSLSIYRYDMAIIGQSGFARRQEVMEVSPEFFSTLGIGPVMGRAFKEEETNVNTDNVAILTDSCWREYFSADPHALGRQIRVNGSLVTVVGVLPPHFRFLSSEARLYLPLSSSLQARLPSERHSGGNVIQMIARLKPGATIPQAQSQIDAQNKTLERDDPQAKMIADAGFRSLVVSLRGDHVASTRPSLMLLQAAVLILLFICTVNLANLLLIRASGRIKEIAVRQALGAGRAHVISETVLETTLLTITGGVLGILIAAGAIPLLASWGAEHLPLGYRIEFDVPMALFGLVVAVVMGVGLSVPVAWFQLGHSVDEGLKSQARGGTHTHAAQRLRHGFVVAQIALSFMLLAAAGLLGVGLKRAMAVSPGFQPDHLISAQVALVGDKYPSPATGLAFIDTLMNGLARQPGISSAGVVNNLPFSGRSGKSAAYVVGHVLRPGESARGHYSYAIGGDYLRAMGFSLLEGRFLAEADSRRSQQVCVVDKDFAAYYWPKGSALGHRLFQGSSPGPDSEAFTVVGVVSATKQAGLTDDVAQGAVYFPYSYSFFPDNHMFLVARAGLPPRTLALALEKTVHRIDSDLVLYDIRPMDARIADSLTGRTTPALLAAVFSAMALLLTAVGTYGVLAYSVAQRRREIGVRIALGARPDQIRGYFFFLAAKLLTAGAVLGLFAAWLTGNAMRSLLFHVRPFDPATFGSAAIIISLVSLGACVFPARRAARISPMQAISDNQ